ncbi:NAD-dependent epimerase/dehydratase family protein [Streptomyces sp. NPDC102360]|uniref:NAD-dependent epimerase/dehydratase family protein n=1 Tax=Streptomyces sp. NPDC102360 TaxID=3366160 RepID=UPI0037F5C67E
MSARPAPQVPGKVFITGAGGFIGTALARRLRELGAEVTGVDLKADADAGIVRGSTTDPGPWAEALEGVDVVIHTAAVVSMVAPYEQAWQVNVLGTRRMIEAAAAAGVRRFVHISSVAAFSHDYPDGVDETYPVRVTGRSTYGDTKVNAEAVALAAHAAGEIDVVVVRPGDVYGPGSVWIREPLKMIKSGQMILPNGGDGIFHAVYVDNLVDGLVLAASAEAASGQIFTVADERGVPARQYFGRLAGWTGRKVRTLPIQVAVPLFGLVGGLQRKLGRSTEVGAATAEFFNRPGSYSIAKARRVLGFEPLVDFEEGMRRSEVWAREEGLV